MLVEDNVVTFPALLTSGAPFVRIVSCNPLEIRGADVAPVFSGYAAADRSGWDDFLAEFDRTHQETWESFNAWVQEQGAPPLPHRDFVHTSDGGEPVRLPRGARLRRRPAARPHLAPARLERPRDRRGLRAARRPSRSGPRARRLIYLSLGSLGGADIGLLQRLIDVLATTPHKVVVSMGPRADELRLAENMVGAAIVPQTKVIPQVDLVITHGGNNTTTESLHFGKPMIVLPLFWDQYDNAQRVHETGFGRRLPTYALQRRRAARRVDELLADPALRERAARSARRSGSATDCGGGAEIIERVGLEHVARRG